MNSRIRQQKTRKIWQRPSLTLPIPSQLFKSRSKKWIRKEEVEKGISIMRVIAGLVAELGTSTTKVAITQKTDTKVTPLFTIARTAPINGTTTRWWCYCKSSHKKRRYERFKKLINTKEYHITTTRRRQHYL